MRAAPEMLRQDDSVQQFGEGVRYGFAVFSYEDDATVQCPCLGKDGGQFGTQGGAYEQNRRAKSGEGGGEAGGIVPLGNDAHVVFEREGRVLLLPGRSSGCPRE